MTPQEAVNSVTTSGIVNADRVQSLATLRLLFESVASTAHDNETRRCADYVRSCRVTDGKVSDERLATIADDLLTIGGLEIES